MTTKATNPVRGIIFDLDGTLYIMRWFMNPLFFVKLFPRGLRLLRYLDIREAFAGMEMGSHERLLAALSEKLAAKERISSAEAMQWIENAFYPSFVDIMPFFRSSRPGIVPLLESLKSRGIKLAVLSDFYFVNERLGKLGLPPPLFDTVASCEGAGALKPHVRPFLDISGKWGIEPQHILVIGDQADTDGAAAGNAGMQFVRISDGWRLPSGALRWKELARRLTELL